MVSILWLGGSLATVASASDPSALLALFAAGTLDTRPAAALRAVGSW